MPESLAYAMFFRQAQTYDTDEGTAMLAWNSEPGIRAFWMKEAYFVIETLGELNNDRD